MEFIIALIVLIIILVWLIKKRNLFVGLFEEVKKQQSDISNYREQRRMSIEDAMNMLGIAHQNDLQAIKNLHPEAQANQLMALGQMYPDLKDTPSYVAAVGRVQNCNAEIASSKNLLNASIVNYNRAIKMFPACIAAMIFGFKRAEFIDENNASNKQVNLSEVNYDSYRMK